MIALTEDNIAAIPFITAITMSSLTSISINSRARFALNESPEEEDIKIAEETQLDQKTKTFLDLCKFRKEKEWKTIFLHGKCANPANMYRGRYYPARIKGSAICAAYIKRNQREILFPKEKWLELDMENSHYSLLWYYLNKKSSFKKEELTLLFPTIENIVFRRKMVFENILSDIQKKTDLPIDVEKENSQIKRELLISLYAFDKRNSYIYSKNQFYQRLHKEICFSMSATKCSCGSHLSERLSNIESELIYEVLNYLNLFEKNTCYLFDGILIK